MPKIYLPKSLQSELDQLANGSCEYCKQLQKFLTSTLQNEHILPISLGGTSELNNLAKACDSCNGSKLHSSKKCLDTR